MLELQARRRDDGPRSESHSARATLAVRGLRGLERDRAGDLLAVRRDLRR